MSASTTDKTSRNGRAWGVKRVALGLVIAVTGTLAATSWAQGGGHDRGFGPGMFMGRSGHMTQMVDHMLSDLNATDAQRAQVKQIAQAAAADLKAQHEASRALREQGLQLFAAPVVDARAVEALRLQTLAQHDQASKRVTQALLDISAVLTPEQRVKLAERIKQRAAHRHQRGHVTPHGSASAPAR